MFSISSGKNGQYIYHTTNGISSVPPDELQCYNWFIQQRQANKFWYFDTLATNPDFVCPCWEDMITEGFDAKWHNVRNITLWDYYDVTCYTSRSFNTPHGMVSVFSFPTTLEGRKWYTKFYSSKSIDRRYIFKLPDWNSASIWPNSTCCY